MKSIGITQRTIQLEKTLENRDSLDIAWHRFFNLLDCRLVILPNHFELLTKNLRFEKLDGLVLTGGDNVASSNELSINRDKCEMMLIEHASQKTLPILGICRGMQLLNHYFGGTLKKCENQVTHSQTIRWIKPSRLVDCVTSMTKINAFHNHSVNRLGHGLIALADNKDVIKAIEHEYLPFMGVMWHPERFVPFREKDLMIFRALFNL